MAIFIKKNGSLQNVSSFIKYNNALIRAGFKFFEEPLSSYISSLEVQKKTVTTYDGTTTYSNESFVSLDVGVSAGESVDVTFDNVTKTLTNNTNANTYMNVKFGTYFGVSDGTTATSGTLVIEGNHYGFGQGEYENKDTGNTLLTGQITGVNLWSDSINEIGYSAFRLCNLQSITIPSSVTSIGNYAFNWCLGLTSIEIPSDVRNIEGYAFNNCSGIGSILYFPNLVSLGELAFYSSSTKNPTTLHFYNTLKSSGILFPTSDSPNKTIYFHFDDNDSVQFSMSDVLSKGSSKYTATYNIYTDNTTIKDQSIALRDSYTTINVYHLDGTSW